MEFEIDNEKIEESFKKIASNLMNDYLLMAGDKSYRICELEFYYSSKSHQDPYIHGHQLQGKMGKWYFHGSGLDLTFGTENILASILIRAIYNLDYKKYIYGPLNSVTELLGNLPGIFGGDFSLRLEPDYSCKIENKLDTPIEAPRIGLNVDKDLYRDYFKKPYRFLVMPKEKHNGKESIITAMEEKKDKSKEEIKKLWNT